MPFHVESDTFGRPVIAVDFCNGRQYFNVEAMIGMFISYMVGLAEKYTNCQIRDIVITCPAYFTENQRRAVKDAGTVAGYNVLCILNEPTAAAIAYGLDNVVKESIILVYDLGGGTFDVSLMKASNKHYCVCGVDGDTHCGGMDLDQLVAKMIEEGLEMQGIEIKKNNKRSQMRLLDRAEKVKIELSVVQSTTIESDTWNGNDEFEITRAEFEFRAKPLIDRTMEIVLRLLKNTNVQVEQVDEVVLIGGSSRIPCIRDRLEVLFGKDKISERIHPDEAVARGATIRAHQIMDSNDIDLLFEEGVPDLSSAEALDFIPDDLVISDCIPMAIGIRQFDDTMSILFNKNQPYPCKKTRKYKTAGLTKKMTFQIYQGDSMFYYHNKLICSFDVELGDVPEDEPMTIYITAEYDADGILQIVAEDRKRNEKKVVTISKQTTNLSSAEIEQMQQLVVETNRKSEALGVQSECKDLIDELRAFILQNMDSVKQKIGEKCTTQLLDGINAYNVQKHSVEEIQEEVSKCSRWIDYLKKWRVCCRKQAIQRTTESLLILLLLLGLLLLLLRLLLLFLLFLLFLLGLLLLLGRLLRAGLLLRLLGALLLGLLLLGRLRLLRAGLLLGLLGLLLGLLLLRRLRVGIIRIGIRAGVLLVVLVTLLGAGSLGLLSLLSLLLLLLLSLLVLLHLLLRASLHVLGLGSVRRHGDHLLVDVSVLLAAHLVDVLVAVLELELVLETEERGDIEELGKIHHRSNLLSDLLGALLLLAQSLGLALDLLHHGGNVLDERDLLLVDHHLGDLGSHLVLVVLLVRSVALVVGVVQLLLQPAVLLPISPKSQTPPR